MSNVSLKNTSLADFIWKNADDLWGDFKHTDFGKIILPFTLLRRLECVLDSTREQVLATKKSLENSGIDMDVVLRQQTGYPFYNTSSYSLATLGATRTRQNLEDYIAHFSDNARVIFEQFKFQNTIAEMDKQGILYKICQNFAKTDLHPDTVPERVMSNVYEHLIRRFGAEVNEAAEDFMTPRDVVHLAIELLLDPDDDLFVNNPGLIRTLYDPTCGTGGFLSDGMEHIQSLRDRYRIAPVVIPYGQELEPETHAVCLASLLLKTLESDPGRDLSKNIKKPGSTLSNDQWADEKFHYCVSNPPFGKKWEKDQDAVVKEHRDRKFEGRFGPKLPRVSDGSMLFLLHLISKLETPEKGGGRAAIVLSGSPLFNGNAGQGESEIRRFLLENDYVEAIVALPTEIFFRTGISTYIWILSNKKEGKRKGKIHLIDATNLYTLLRKSEGNKKRFISSDQTRQIVACYSAFEPSKVSKIFDYQDFGYRRIKVLRPLRMKIIITKDGLEQLDSHVAWQKLTQAQKEAWIATLITCGEIEHTFDWLEPFVRAAAKKNPALGKVGKPLLKAFIASFGKRNPDADPVVDADGNVIIDDTLTTFENVPLQTRIDEYMEKEVLPYARDAFVDRTIRDDQDGEIGIVGYEISFSRHFYEFQFPRELDVIEADLKVVEEEINDLLKVGSTKKFQPHPEYRSSIAPWLQALPKNWSEQPFFTVGSETKNRNLGMKENNLLSLSYGKIVRKDIDAIGGLTPESYETYQIVEKDQIVFRFTDLQNDKKSLRSALCQERGIVTSAYLAIKVDNINPSFFNYMMRAYDLSKVFYSMAGGLRQSLGFDDVRRMPIALPPELEQNQIARCLDQELHVIDELIRKKQESIELLKERKSSLVFAATTGKVAMQAFDSETLGMPHE